MTTFSKLTPNLLVADVERSLSFYTEVLGFGRGFTVPEQSPFVFGSVVSGPIEIFFNERETATKEYPGFAGKPIGISGTMFIELQGTGPQVGLYAQSGDRPVFQRIRTAGAQYGINAIDCFSASVRDCRIDNCYQAALVSSLPNGSTRGPRSTQA